MTKTLSVSAIKDGTVIDHIPTGQALRILRLLNVADNKNCITIGLNLASKSLGHKDLIKIEQCVLTDDETNKITMFAPKATINIIENFEITKKIKAQPPRNISGIFTCPNPTCISQTELIKTFFYLEEYGKHIKLICKYCEREFDRDQMTIQKAVI